MGVYDIEIEGANVKVSIVDNPAFVGTKMDELRSSLLYPKKKKKRRSSLQTSEWRFSKKKKKNLQKGKLLDSTLSLSKLMGI